MTKAETEDVYSSVPFNALHLLPPVSAVCIAENDREDILYTGSARNLWQRWQDHRMRCLRQVDCTRIFWAECPAQGLDHNEKRWIQE